jgi:hypothetical protein
MKDQFPKVTAVFGLWLMATFLAYVLTGCQEDELPGDDPAFDEVLMAAGKTEPIAPDKDEVTEVEKDTLNGHVYTYEKHDIVDNVESIVYLGLNDDIIWPGNLVKGEKANDFVYEPIVLLRAPITFSISLESSSVGESLSQTVDEPKLSTVRQGISDLLKKAVTSDTKVPAKVDFTYQEMHSESQMNLFVGADINYGAGSLKSKFDWESSTKKTRIMAKYTQIYYSIDVDPPASPRRFFASSVSADEAEFAMPTGSSPLYVASVSYGMMALIFIESDYTSDVMDQALQVAYGKGNLDSEIAVGVSTRRVMENSSISIVVYGGSTAGLKDLETGMQGFLNVINASKDFTKDSPGVPLVYKFRHVVDNTLALVTLTSQYTLVKALQIEQRVRVKVNRFVIVQADDEGFDNDIEIDRLYVYANAFEREDASSDFVQINPVDQRVYAYSSAGDGHVVGSGAIIQAGNFIDLTFHTNTHNYSLAKIQLSAWARDYDGGSANEEDRKSIELSSDQFTANPHTIRLSSADFEIDAEISLELLN